MPQEEVKRALIVARTYPTPQESGVESSCTAAITDTGDWLRLFPVPWRLLPEDQRFRKYQWVEVRVMKASEDPRRESYKLRADGIRILSSPLSSARGWLAKKDVVFPMRSPSLCHLEQQRNAHQHPTLGFFRPKSIRRLLISPGDHNWTDAQQAMLRQEHLFVETPKQQLEKIPFIFRYEFRCVNDECHGHTLMCTDWEMSQSYRKWIVKYGDGWKEKFRQTYEAEMIQQNDTQFFVGTVRSHPNRWIIIGLFYPERSPQGPGLFELE